MATSAIQHNIPSMNAYRNYSANGSRLSKNLERLASGYKINRAGDDAAGLAISEKMRAQISGLTGAEKNAKDGISLIQTAEGALTEVHDMLNRMTTLAEQSANGTYQNELDREQLQKEMSQLKDEINRIADSTNFNGQKLLDGTLATRSDAFAIDSSEINSTLGVNNPNMADGITINAPTDGAGENQSYTMHFDAGTLFGVGDEISLGVKDVSTSNVTPAKIKYDAGGRVTGHMHDQFNGDKLEDQLNNIADSLNFEDTTGAGLDGAAFKAGYEATVRMNDDGSGDIILTAKTTGAQDYTMDSVSVADTQSKSTATKTDANVGTASTALGAADIKLLGGDANSFYVNSGDKLTFEFEVNGKTMYAQIEEGKDFYLDSTDTLADKTTKIVNALNTATFMDVKKDDQIVPASTGSASAAAITINAAGETKTVDESQLKVSDYFKISANKDADDTAAQGAVKFEQNTTAGGVGDTANGTYVKVKNAYLTNSNGSAKNIAATLGASNDDDGAAGTVTAESTAVALADAATTTTAATDMSLSEKFKVSGTLKDGRSFEIELSAVKQGTAAADLGKNEFALGGSFAATATNIKNALVSADNEVKVTNADGSDGGTLKASDLFAASGTGTDFTVSTSSNTITITNTEAVATGKGLAAAIDADNTGVVAGSPISTTLESAGGVQSGTENLITFDPAKIEQGTSLVIDGKTYEFVSDAKFTTNENNVAVVVSNLGEDGVTGEDLANALKSVLDNDTADDGIYQSASGGNYSLNVDGNKLAIKSKDIGSDVKALDVAMGANKASSVLTISTTDAGTLDDPTKTVASVKAGDTVTIGGKVYEFTEGKGASNADHTAVSLLDDNGNKMTSADAVAQRLADVVNDTAGSSSDTEAGIIARADGGKVIFTGKYNALADAKGKDAYAAPDVKLTGNGGLTLQIGDTSDSYNKLTVSVNDMHTSAMGIDDVDISTQEGAAAALDKIKSAVNYVSDVRGSLGAMQNRLDHTINNLGVMKENIQSAESLIRDTDVAEEMMNYTKNNILNQSAQAMLAQANQLPQGVLQLLG